MTEAVEGLVPDRSCGGCTACCTALRVDQPELQKPAGETCRNCAEGAGCTIYETRPRICRTWFCGWRRFDWIGPALRPDRSDVLVHFIRDEIPPGFASPVGIAFAVLARSGLKAEGLAEAVAHAVRTNHATFLLVPYDGGRSGTRLFLNDTLEQAVLDNRPAAVLRDLGKMYSAALLFGDATGGDPPAFTDWSAAGDDPPGQAVV